MKGFLLILLLSFFPPLQCSDKLTDFFVTRRDNKEAICIESRWGYSPFPTFDLDKMKIPQDVGFMYWDWLVDWKLPNDINVRRNGDRNVLIAGNQPFYLVRRNYGETFVSIVASNITLWVVNTLKPRGRGLLFELDHLNETTKLKDTTLKYCDENPEVEGAKCTILDYKNGTNFLNDGNHWTRFLINFKENRTGVEMIEGNYGKEKPVVHCTWKNTNISDPFTSYDFDVFAKSHQRNAAFFSEDIIYPDLANNNEMKRNYTKRSSGKFCVQVKWNKDESNDSNELMHVKNLASRGVEPAANATHGFYSSNFQWNHLDAGEYEFTLRVDKRKPYKIDLCPDDDSKIWRTWRSYPKAITKCQIHLDFSDEFSAGPSSPPDPTLKPKWTLEAWEHVCDRLGIFSNDTEVQIKFCNRKGCNFSKCPHLQDEPPYIFDF